MNFCFILGGMQNRKHLLQKCISALNQSKYKGTDAFLYFQGDSLDGVEGISTFTDIVMDRKPRGVFTPRYELMKRFSREYDFTILIDDDLYISPHSNFEKSISLFKQLPFVGCVSGTNSKIVPGKIERQPDVNIDGGLVFSRESIEVILDYFKDQERDYTFDVFWLLLYVKGYDNYKDWRTYSDHRVTVKVDGKFSGFNWARANLPYVPMMQEWFKEPKPTYNHGRIERRIPSIRDITEEGMAERKLNLRRLGRL